VASLLNSNVAERALWTGAQALIALAVTYLGDVPAWWAAPIALALSAVKTNVVDRRAAKREAKEAEA
jgi:hypothetical protein